MTPRRSFLKMLGTVISGAVLLPLVRVLPKTLRIGMIIPGKWHHIARRVELGRETLYLDGVEVDEILYAGDHLKTPDHLFDISIMKEGEQIGMWINKI